jgi:hypothetical protein
VSTISKWKDYNLYEARRGGPYLLVDQMDHTGLLDQEEVGAGADVCLERVQGLEGLCGVCLLHALNDGTDMNHLKKELGNETLKVLRSHLQGLQGPILLHQLRIYVPRMILAYQRLLILKFLNFILVQMIQRVHPELPQVSPLINQGGQGHLDESLQGKEAQL